MNESCECLLREQNTALALCFSVPKDIWLKHVFELLTTPERCSRKNLSRTCKWFFKMTCDRNETYIFRIAGYYISDQIKNEEALEDKSIRRFLSSSGLWKSPSPTWWTVRYTTIFLEYHRNDEISRLFKQRGYWENVQNNRRLEINEVSIIDINPSVPLRVMQMIPWCSVKRITLRSYIGNMTGFCKIVQSLRNCKANPRHLEIVRGTKNNPVQLPQHYEIDFAFMHDLQTLDISGSQEFFIKPSLSTLPVSITSIKSLVYDGDVNILKISPSLPKLRKLCVFSPPVVWNFKHLRVDLLPDTITELHIPSEHMLIEDTKHDNWNRITKLSLGKTYNKERWNNRGLLLHLPKSLTCLNMGVLDLSDSDIYSVIKSLRENGVIVKHRGKTPTSYDRK